MIKYKNENGKNFILIPKSYVVWSIPLFYLFIHFFMWFIITPMIIMYSSSSQFSIENVILLKKIAIYENYFNLQNEASRNLFYSLPNFNFYIIEKIKILVGFSLFSGYGAFLIYALGPSFMSSLFISSILGDRMITDVLYSDVLGKYIKITLDHSGKEIYFIEVLVKDSYVPLEIFLIEHPEIMDQINSFIMFGIN